MTARKFTKKPVVIEAIQYTGTNASEIADWVGESYVDGLRVPVIRTLEGDMSVTMDDWIIKGIQGEFYPYKPDIFEASYEEVE